MGHQIISTSMMKLKKKKIKNPCFDYYYTRYDNCIHTITCKSSLVDTNGNIMRRQNRQFIIRKHVPSKKLYLDRLKLVSNDDPHNSGGNWISRQIRMLTTKKCPSKNRMSAIIFKHATFWTATFSFIFSFTAIVD